jgi:serine/threonine-protein kinase
MSGPPSLPPSIGRYRPVGVLGSGAMGTVYKAHDPAIDRIVAIKLIRTDALEQDMRDEYIERFKREVQTAGRCNHAAIVRVFDFSGDVHNPFIVMEMVDGVPLNHLLRDPARRVEQTIIPVLLQVLDGLGYAHRLGITHRDVKPGNILVSPEGHAKIVDFGIARLAEGSMTQAGSMLGTPSYMSPEQVSESDVDHRADLFSVGAILYEAFAGKPPFVGRNLSDTILRLSLPDPASMEPILAAGAGAFIPLLQRALAKRREARFQSAEDFAAALATCLGAAAPSMAPDHTVLMASGAMAPPPIATSREATPLPPAPSPATLTGSMFETRWEPQVLDRIERALASYAGPVARVMVREAARASTTAEELVQALAQRLATASDRSQFLRAVTSGGGQDSLAATVLGQPGPPSFSGRTTIGRPVAPAPIAAAAIETAQAALAVFVGPMARVFARKAAAEAASHADFIERLCAHVPKPDDNKALRRKLQGEMEPRPRG